MRLDWDTCLHCGLHDPVARPFGRTVVRSVSPLLLVAAVVATGVNATALWHMLQEAPERVVRQAVAATTVAASVAARAAPSTAGRLPAPSLPGMPRPPVRVPLAIAAAGDSLANARYRCVAAGYARRRLADSTLLQAIAACPSVATLDSLERQLRETFPSEPTLREGGRAWRQFAARRTALLSTPGSSGRTAARVRPPARR